MEVIASPDVVRLGGRPSLLVAANMPVKVCRYEDFCSEGSGWGERVVVRQIPGSGGLLVFSAISDGTKS